MGMNQIEMTDFSAQASIVIKGMHAASWLAEQKMSVPESVNHWLLHVEGCLVLRLGMQEFLVQKIAQSGHSHTDHCLAMLESSLARNLHKTNGVLCVPGADTCMKLSGDGVTHLFAQTCRLNLGAELQDHVLVRTQVAGINATLLQMQADIYLWFDQSYHAYMVETMTQLIEQPTPINPLVK